MPDWSLKQGIFHAVLASRRGQLPAVRALIDHMSAEFLRLIDELCRSGGGTALRAGSG